MRDLTESLSESFSAYFPISAAVAVSSWNRTLDSYRELILDHFNSVTADNTMKPNALQEIEGYFNFDVGINGYTEEEQAEYYKDVFNLFLDYRDF
ncbi:MAG: endo-1,4-beta-xylanase, partial [Halanaerobiales bacterium]